MLDEWQQAVIRGALGENRDGRWQTFEVGLIVSRQNGKGSILEALELFWLFLCDEDRLILHSAHEFKTAREGFLRIRGLIEATPDLREQVKQFYASTGGECGIELLNGKRLRFVARSSGAGRGFSPDKLVLDEAYNLPESAIDAVLPSVGARPNPQVWYTSSAGDFNIAPCDVLARVRRRGIKGEDDSLAFFEWSVPYDDETGEIKGKPDDPRLWAMANPSMGIRKKEERIANFQRSMSAAGFAREELGVGTWPPDEDAENRVISSKAWSDVADAESRIVDRHAFALDVSPNQSSSAICVAGVRPDGLSHIEVTGRADVSDHRAGTEWIIPRLLELHAAQLNFKIYVASGSAAESLVPAITEAGITAEVVKGSEVAPACGLLFQQVTTSLLRHTGQRELTAAVAGASKVDVGDGAWKWTRRKSSTDITPLYAATVALWVANRKRRTPNVW